LTAQAMRQVMPPGLYVVATPIGNLADLTVRAATILARADRIYCEDTRTTRHLLQAVGLSRRLSTYHDHNGEAVRPGIVEAIAAGATVALVSDAGTPVISDPGNKLVRDVAAAGHPVFAIPGASALTAAASVAGLPSDTLLFLGFLPAKTAARRARLQAFADIAATLVLYEAPQRVTATLSDAAEVLGDRAAVAARELTKAFEETRRDSLTALADWARAEKPRGEFVVLIAPPDASGVEVDDAALAEALGEVMADLPLGAAAKRVSQQFGVARSRVYDLGLRLKAGTDDTDPAS
jgi:16S rRNA (cytidine1402-2'-O)-methyltransferase